MGITVVTPVSDAAIRRHLPDQETYQLKDDRRNVILRYNQARTSASWHVIRYAGGKAIWRKVGNWPAINSKTLFGRLPEINAQMAVDPKPELVRVGQLSTVGQVLAWYLTRAKNDRNISPRRRSAIKCAIRRHLAPAIGLASIHQVDRKYLDAKLIWPLQREYALSTVQAHFRVLKSAMRQAERLGLIDSDPCSGIKFSDFIDRPIEPKPGRLRSDMVPALFDDLAGADEQVQFLVLMMLLHGTRLGETVRAKRCHFSPEEWHLPGPNTKTRKPHNIPITSVAEKVIDRYMPRKSGRYVFASNAGNKLSDSKSSEIIRGHTKGAWSSHDLRKLARTVWADLGVEYFAAEILLNHSLRRMDQTYIHTYAKQRTREALAKYHAWLLDNGLKKFLNI